MVAVRSASGAKHGLPVAAQQQRKRGVEGRIIEKKDPEDEGEDTTRARVMP